MAPVDDTAGVEELIKEGLRVDGKMVGRSEGREEKVLELQVSNNHLGTEVATHLFAAGASDEFSTGRIADL